MNEPLHIALPPRLRTLVEAGRKQPGLADMTAEQCRAFIAARTAARARGPEIETVRDFLIPAGAHSIGARLYRPVSAMGAALVFHGGGWLMGNPDSFDSTCRHLANESGLAIVSLDYRLAPEHPFPAAFNDAWTALQWMVRNADAVGVDTRRIAVLGESAGGNLAAAVCLQALHAGVDAIALQVLIYPSVDARLQIASLQQFADGPLQTTRDVHHAFRTYGLGTVVEATDWRISPLLAPSHAGLPRALIISAGQDGVRDDSYSYAECLQGAGVEAVHVCYPQMVHTFFGMRGILPEAAFAQQQAAHALRAAFVPGAAR